MILAMRLLLLTVAMLTFTPLAHAWNAAGHRLIAVIAWQHMDGETRQWLSQTLAAHEDYPRWTQQPGGEASESLIMAEASLWADEIRHDPRYQDDPDEPPSAFSAEHKLRHRHWHYVNSTVSGTNHANKGQLDKALAHVSRRLAHPGESSQQAEDLLWLLHLVGDSHQPLHCFDLDGTGGNATPVTFDFKPHRPASNLHQYWDDLPGTTRLRGQRLLDTADKWSQGAHQPKLATPDAWIKESAGLAHTHIYPAVLLGNPAITADAHRSHEAIARQRIVEAGFRLGQWLNRIERLRRVSRETRTTSP